MRVFGTAWVGDPATPETPVAVPAGSRNQLSPLPWTGIDRVRIEFSEDVLVAEEDLVVTGLNVAAYPLVGFDYDPVATWALNAPIDADDLTLDLSDGVSDRVSLALDGDWDNPTDVDDDSSNTFPSGDGTAGWRRIGR